MKAPIADPFAPIFDSKNRLFGVNLFKLFVNYGIIYLFLLAPILWLIVAPIRGHAKFWILLIGLLTATLFSALTGLIYTIEVSGEGLRGANAWGVKRIVVWDEITRARFAWLGLSYVLTSCSGKRSLLYIPLDLSDKKGFDRTVEETAPADNPLRLFLAKRKFR